MIKWAAGCLVVIVIAAAALATAGYFGYRAFSPMIDNAQAVLQQARDAAAEDARLENTGAYAPPADGTLTEPQVRRLLAVHARTRQAGAVALFDAEAELSFRCRFVAFRCGSRIRTDPDWRTARALGAGTD